MSPWLDLDLDVVQQPSLFEQTSYDFIEPTSLGHFASMLLTGSACVRSTGVCPSLIETAHRAKSHIGLIRWLRDHTLNLLPFFRARSLRKYAPPLGQAGSFHFPAVKNLPPNGVLVLSGKHEVLDSQIQAAVRPISSGDKVVHYRHAAGVHAWPVSLYFLGRDSVRASPLSCIVV
jgi:hypothetical protein